MSEIPVGTSVAQPNGSPRTEGFQNPPMNEEDKEPISAVVGFSDPNVSLVPPAGVTLQDPSSVTT